METVKALPSSRSDEKPGDLAELDISASEKNLLSRADIEELCDRVALRARPV